MSVVRNLMIRAGADFSGLRKEMNRAVTDVKSFQSRMSSALKKVAAVVGAIKIGEYLKGAADDAIQVESAMQVINRTLGVSAAAFGDWANNSASAFNMTKSAAIRYGSIYSNLISGFSKDTKETEQRTVDLLEASAVVASGTGRTMDDVLDRIRSGLLGNTEAIEDLGINVNVAMIQSTNAFKRFAGNKSWEQLDFQTQQTIRYFAIMEQASSKFGAEINNNTASKIGQLTTALGNTKLALGQAFLPIINVVVPLLTTMANAILSVVRVIAAFIEALFGYSDAQKKTAATNAQAKAVKGLGNAYKDAGAKAAKAKNGVAGFDEVNPLNDPTKDAEAGAAGLGDGAAGPILPDTKGVTSALEPVSAAVQAFADKVRSGFQTVADFVVQHKEIIGAAIGGIVAAFAAFEIITSWSAIISGFMAVVDALAAAFVALWAAITGPIALIAIAIGALVAAFIYFYQTNDKFRGIVDGILKAIGDAAIWLWNNVLVPFGAWLMDSMPKAWDAVTTAATWFWKQVLVPIGEALKWFWDNVVTPLASVLSDVLGVAWDNLSKIAMSFWKEVLVPLGDAIKTEFGPTVDTLATVFNSLWEHILKPFGSWLLDTLKVAFDGIVTVITKLWDTLKPVVSWVGDTFVTVFESAFKSIGAVIKDLQTEYEGILKFLTGVFTGDWGKAWEGVKQVFKGVFDALVDIAKAPLNMIITSINSVIDGLNKINIKIPDWVPGFGGQSFGISIPKIPKLARGGIVDSPTIAQIGEAGPEAVVPLENTSFVDTLAGAIGTAVMGAMQFSGGGSQKTSGDINLSIDGTTFARILNPFLVKEGARLGGSMIRAT